MSSIDEISGMFQSESGKLANLINAASANPELTIHEIIETYYQVMNVSSMIAMLRQHGADDHRPLIEDIERAEKSISEFNAGVHPEILSHLTHSIQNMTKKLQSDSGEKSRKEVEDESKSYEELRRLMSTKEFAEQYSQGLPHD